MWIVRLALRRPYTFVVVSLLIAILGVTAIITMPVDIFPYIDIPVVSVVWSYTGMLPEEMEKRILTVFERAMTTTVNDIDAGRYLPLYRYPRGQRGLVLYRHAARRDGKAHSHRLRAGHDHHRKRYRAHRIAGLQRWLRHPRLLPAQREGLTRAGADYRHLPNPAPPLSGGDDTAEHYQVRRIERADPPARPAQRYVKRARSVRPGAEFHPHPAGHYSGCGGAVALWRQVPSDHGRSRPRTNDRQGTVRLRRLFRPGQSEPHLWGRNRQDRRQGLSD